MATTTTTTKPKTAKSAPTTVKATAPQTTASVTKSGNTVTGRFTLKNLATFDLKSLPSFDAAESRPFLAVVGVADLALERVKDVPALYAAEARRVQALLADVPAQVKALPTQVEQANKKATDVYASLTVRGERLVTAIRRQPSTQATIAEGKQAVRRAESAATAAKRSVKAGERAVEDAAGKIG